MIKLDNDKAVIRAELGRKVSDKKVLVFLGRLPVAGKVSR